MSISDAQRAQEVSDGLHVQRDGLAGEHLVLMDLDRVDARGGTFERAWVQ